MTGMASARATLYNMMMRRTSLYVTACVVGSYAGTHMYLQGADSVWKWINKGVSLHALSEDGVCGDESLQWG